MSYLLAKELKRSKYRLLGLVGQGQFGQVYCASHRKTGRLVALKELDKQRFPTHKFLRELRFLLSLQHPNIVTCHALEHTSTGRYLVMDYCEGGTLRSLIEDNVRLHPAEGLRLIIDVLSGLDHAHSRGIVHCDIKPENILLTLQADGWTARLSDFGIARLCQESVSDGAGNTGSPAYMAPERFYGQYSVVSDLYAVGILLFELLVGDRPFSGAPADIMAAHLNHPVKIPATVPAALQTIILMALQKLPARRFQTALEMLTALRVVAEKADFGAEPLWIDARLLRSPLMLPVNPCQFVCQEPLQAEVRQLITSGKSVPPQPDTHSNSTTDTTVAVALPGVVMHDRVYQVFKNYVGCRIYSEERLSGDSNHLLEYEGRSLVSTVRLPTAVRELLVRPQGCFAITQRSVYRITTELFQSGIIQHRQTQWQQSANSSALQQHAVPKLVAEFSRDFSATIAADGRYMAVAVQEPDKATNSLSFWNLARMQPTKLSSRSGIAASATRLTTHLFRLTMPDARHLVAFSHAVDKTTHSHITGVLLEIFTRRGNPVSALHLPVPLRYVLGSPSPYRLVAMEPGHSHSILLIDLKPLKLSRIGVDVAPIVFAASSWGYALMAADGQILLLDHHGQSIGRLEGPAHPTAIAILEPYSLLITTWNNGQGSLYTIDLRQLNVRIVFQVRSEE